MQTQTFENAGEELDHRAHAYADKRGCSYAEALGAVAREDPGLYRRYMNVTGESGPDPEDMKGAGEFRRRIKAYSEHFHISRDEAERRVRAHDPNMRKYFRQGGSIAMSTEQVPLDPGSVVDTRVQALLSKGSVKSYGEAMKAVLAGDDLLSHCYQKGLPYLEASAHAYEEDPMRSSVVQAIVGPPSRGQVTQTTIPPSETGTTAMQELGVLISGARLPDNSPDVPLMLRISNMVPQLVRDAAGERMVQIAYKLIDTLGLTGVRSDRFPEAFRQAQREHPGLAAASVGGIMNEDALRDIFFGWFSREK
jgi:hypothetical protein